MSTHVPDHFSLLRRAICIKRSADAAGARVRCWNLPEVHVDQFADELKEMFAGSHGAAIAAIRMGHCRILGARVRVI